MLQIKVVEEIETHILCSITFSENRAVREIMSKYLVKPETLQITIWRRVECWISKATRAQTHARALHTHTYIHTRTHPRAHTHKYVTLLLLLFNLGARWVRWLTPRPGRVTSGKDTRYPLYRRLGGPQGRPGQVRRIPSPPGFNPRTVQPAASRYTDWAIPAHWIWKYRRIKDIVLCDTMPFSWQGRGNRFLRNVATSLPEKAPILTTERTSNIAHTYKLQR